MYQNYKMSYKEFKDAQKWVDEHECSIRDKYLGAIGGGLTVCFTQTSIGCAVVLKCGCGESFNATDYDSW